MLEMYYKDFDANQKQGKWGVKPNRLIRYDLEDKELYFYDFKERTFGMSVMSIFLNAIVDPFRFVLVDDGQVMPLSIIDRYKFFDKIITEYYHVKNQLELNRNMNAIRSMSKPKKQKTNKYQSRLDDMDKAVNKKKNNNLNDRLDEMINTMSIEGDNYNSQANGNQSFAFGSNTTIMGGQNNRVNNGHSGRSTDMGKLNDKINRLMKINEERVKRGY